MSLSKNMMKYVTLLTLFFASLSVAKAGLYLEPYAGVALAGKLERKTTSFPTFGDYSGVQIGGRAGYSMLGFMGGLTLNLAMKTDIEATSGVVRTNDGVTRRDIGAFVGFNFPILVRVWASYYFNSMLEGQDPGIHNTLDSSETYNGNGYSIGVGFTGLPFLSLNLELRNFTYDEQEDIDASPQTTTFNPEYTSNEVFVSISLPLDL